MEITKIRKVLIANRGEIACRVARTCQALGIRTVAVYSDADRLSLHTLLCGEAVHIGPAPSNESYLIPEKILAAAKETGADAIHPGYGFLSENADFAEAVEAAGLIWIGPPAEAIRGMGIKHVARQRMIEAGVPVVPGTHTPLQDGDEAEREGTKIGFPLLIKASAGGGGKGMRLVERQEDLREAFERASSEALSATGDGSCYMERYFPISHHIEVQILSDASGKAVAVGERECSVQRRHQKVIEECPSPFLDDSRRQAIFEAAVAAADACGYVGAGTVEFLVDPEKNFYFLEMNTRLQVEHAVTEMVYGVDLVEQQLRIAAGLEPVRDFLPRGSAIEVRIYAEDARENFRPCPGPIHLLKEPHGPSLRVDSGVYQGAEISRFYDPMISKVIAWGADRPAAIRRMIQGLREYVVEGVSTTIPFCIAALENPVFQSGVYTTAFIGQDIQPDAQPFVEDPEFRLDLARIAAAVTRRRLDASRARERGSPEKVSCSTGLSPFQLAGRLDRLRIGRI
jgi:acetyl-CoA carboxylase biotin carboxylase subunit